MQFPKERPQEYLAKLAGLYSNLKIWSKPLDIQALQYEVNLHEEALGAYKAPAMKLYLNNELLTEVRPVGAAIIGASGRVDFLGSVGTATVIYLEKGGPRITLAETNGTRSPTRHGPLLFLGINQAGWYWIQDHLSSKALPLDKELFFSLLSSVSDHAFAQSA
jgi:hypothetical protein